MLALVSSSIPLGLQVFKRHLPWSRKYANMAYFGLLGAPGYESELWVDSDVDDS